MSLFIKENSGINKNDKGISTESPNTDSIDRYIAELTRKALSFTGGGELTQDQKLTIKIHATQLSKQEERLKKATDEKLKKVDEEIRREQERIEREHEQELERIHQQRQELHELMSSLGLKVPETKNQPSKEEIKKEHTTKEEIEKEHKKELEGIHQQRQELNKLLARFGLSLPNKE